MIETTTPISSTGQQQASAALVPAARKSWQRLLAALGAQVGGLLAVLLITLSPAQAQTGIVLEPLGRFVGLQDPPTTTVKVRYRVKGAAATTTPTTLASVRFSVQVLRSAVTRDGTCRTGVLERGKTCRREGPKGEGSQTLKVDRFEQNLELLLIQGTRTLIAEGEETEAVSMDFLRIVGAGDELYKRSSSRPQIDSDSDLVTLEVSFSATELAEEKGYGYIVVRIPEGGRFKLTGADGKPRGPSVTCFSFGSCPGSSSGGGGGVSVMATALAALLFFANLALGLAAGRRRLGS